MKVFSCHGFRNKGRTFLKMKYSGYSDLNEKYYHGINSNLICDESKISNNNQRLFSDIPGCVFL